MGVMLTGEKGSGKSRASEILANKAIDYNMCVVMVTDVTTNIAILPFLESLYNMVIIFDEFSKNFDMRLQNKMLTMFSAIGPDKKLFILTENDRCTVSPYLRTRPGRVKYAIDYNRLKQGVVIEYCKDNGVYNTPFFEELMDIYSRASKFTFDHLQALVSEHIFVPDYTMEELLEILNLDELVPDPLWYPVKAVKIATGEEWEIRRADGRERQEMSNNYFRCWLDMSAPIDEGKSSDNDSEANNPFGGRPQRESVNINVQANELDRMSGDKYIFISNGFEITFDRRD